MTNLPEMSNRAKQALDVLADGGRFSHCLERNSYTGREQFRTRLQTANGYNVAGIGFSTMAELQKLGFITHCHHTCIGDYYKLAA